MLQSDPNHTPTTKAEAEVFLIADLQIALDAALRYCPVLATEPEERLAAIVDFSFNLGADRPKKSILRLRVNDRDWSGATEDLLAVASHLSSPFTPCYSVETIRFIYTCARVSPYPSGQTKKNYFPPRPLVGIHCCLLSADTFDIGCHRGM